MTERDPDLPEHLWLGGDPRSADPPAGPRRRSATAVLIDPEPPTEEQNPALPPGRGRRFLPLIAGIACTAAVIAVAGVRLPSPRRRRPERRAGLRAARGQGRCRLRRTAWATY